MAPGGTQPNGLHDSDIRVSPHPSFFTPKFLHNPCEMWKDNLWRFLGENFSSQRLWKERKVSTSRCGQNSAASLKHSQVIHINFLYDDCYYLISCKYIYIFIVFKERKNPHALYL